MIFTYRFRPSRWLDLPPGYHPMYSAFLLGPQSCIGKFMAILEMKAILAYVTFVQGVAHADILYFADLL